MGATVIARTSFGALECPTDDEYITPRLLAQGVWEPAETAWLSWRLRPGMTFVDVGAHVGYFTVLAAARVGPAGRVVAFEPDPANFELLRRNVERNGCGNVLALPAAVGAAGGLRQLHRAGRNTGDHRLDAVPGEARDAVEVTCVALDDHPAVEGAVDVVKVDVQGAEPDVLRGMRALVARSPGLAMLVEFDPDLLAAAGTDPAALLDEVERLGFTVAVQFPGRAFPVPFVRERVLGGAAVNLVLTRAR